MTWKNEGTPPDYRFTLANERTFLAWIRTALAFMAAAIGIDQLAVGLAPDILKAALVAGLSLMAAGSAYYAYHRWVGNERAMRLEAELPFPHGLILLGTSLFIVIMLIMLMLLVPR